MTTESAPRHQRALKVLGFVFPLTALLAVIGSVLTYAAAGADLLWLVYVLGGLGVGLGVAYFVLSIVRAHSRPKGHTKVSLILALLLMACAGFAIFAEHFVANFSIFGPPTPPTLAWTLKDQARLATVPAGKFLTTGKSGELTNPKWNNPAGGQISIAISWSKNADGLMVTASPEGKVPKDQDGTPYSQQVWKNGKVEYPLDYYLQEGKEQQSSSLDILSGAFFMLNDLVNASAKPIIDYAKKHDGKLPDAAEASSLLVKAKKEFTLWSGDAHSGSKPKEKTSKTKEDNPKSQTMFVIDEYIYRAVGDGLFTITYSWSCSFSNQDLEDLERLKYGTNPVKGIFTIDYSASSMMGLDADYAKRPLKQIGNVFDKRENENEERAEKARKATKAAKPAKEAKEKSAAGKNSGS